MDNDIINGMQQAEKRYGALFPSQIEAQYREIQERKPAHTSHYVRREENEAPILTPRQKNGLAVFAVSSLIVSSSAALFQVIASGAINTLLMWSFGGGMALFFLSGFRSAPKGRDIARSCKNCTNCQCKNINITINQ